MKIIPSRPVVDKINAGTFIGEDNGPGKRTGLQSFVENNLVSMIAIPGITMPECIIIWFSGTGKR